MNQKLTFLFVILQITTHILYAQNKNKIDTTTIIENTRKINSIESTSANSDLRFLNDELEHVEILMLGEQSHGDGSTFLAKTRMIKYLHEKQDFNVLVFESGLMDAYRVWKMIRDGNVENTVFDYGIFPVWTNSKQTKELFAYILSQSKTDNPLYIAGFDMQPTGSSTTPDMRWNELSSYLIRATDFNEKDFPLFTKVFKNIGVVLSAEFTDADFQSLTNEFRKLKQIISEKDTTEKGKITARYIDNYLKTIEFYRKADFHDPSKTPHVFNIRDKEMAENLAFLKEEIYPDEKLIVWGANSHLGYGRGFLEDFLEYEAQDKGMVPMGQYLKIEYQDKIYSLAFTSYNGAIGSLKGKVTNLKPAHELTLESRLVSLGFENAYISMKDKNIKTVRFPARIYGHTEMSGVWGQMCDGIYFIKEMIPNERRHK